MHKVFIEGGLTPEARERRDSGNTSSSLTGSSCSHRKSAPTRRPAWTHTLTCYGRRAAQTCDAVAHRADLAELFDIEMDGLARMLAFITPYRFGRLQGTELVQSSQPREKPG